jgi:acetyltransferase-like isoleucine patch superfamily enzyme
VAIGRDVWLGAKVTVLRGSTIGDGSVVGANAVVGGDIPPASLAVGVPARVLKTLKASEASP